jgi:hypothetical protein
MLIEACSFVGRVYEEAPLFVKKIKQQNVKTLLKKSTMLTVRILKKGVLENASLQIIKTRIFFLTTRILLCRY